MSYFRTGTLRRVCVWCRSD